MSKSAITAAAAERAEQAATKLRQAELEQRVAELAERIRQSDLAGRAQATAAGLQEKGAELAARAQPKVEELTARGSDLAARAQERGSELAGVGLRRVGERLAQGRAGERLGIQPAGSVRRWPWMIVGVLGIAAGFAIGLLTKARKADRLQDVLDEGARHVAPLADAIRAELTSDPRTAGLPDLDVNISDGVVFVRGTIPPDFDEKALREIIERVPGVEDVDVQVVTATA